MARLPILAVLLTASLMTQAVMPEWMKMPEWMSQVGEYCTLDACAEGWKNTTVFAEKHATAVKDAVVEHPYYAAAIATATVGAGIIATKCYNARKAYNKRMQEVQDCIFALILQDEDFARETERQVNGGMLVPDVDILHDEAMAHMLQLLLQDEEFARQLNAELNGQEQVLIEPVNIAHDAALAERLSHELGDALREHERQIAADAAYAQTLVEAY